MDETLLCDHSSERYWVVLSNGTVCLAAQGGSNYDNLNFKSVDLTLVFTIEMKAVKEYFRVVLFVLLCTFIK